jgi:hypothetical protein
MDPFRHFGRTPWTRDEPLVRPLSSHDKTTQNADIIHALNEIQPLFVLEWATTICTLDREATGISAIIIRVNLERYANEL